MHFFALHFMSFLVTGGEESSVRLADCTVEVIWRAPSTLADSCTLSHRKQRDWVQQCTTVEGYCTLSHYPENRETRYSNILKCRGKLSGADPLPCLTIQTGTAMYHIGWARYLACTLSHKKQRDRVQQYTTVWRGKLSGAHPLPCLLTQKTERQGAAMFNSLSASYLARTLSDYQENREAVQG